MNHLSGADACILSERVLQPADFNSALSALAHQNARTKVPKTAFVYPPLAPEATVKFEAITADLVRGIDSVKDSLGGHLNSIFNNGGRLQFDIINNWQDSDVYKTYDFFNDPRHFHISDEIKTDQTPHANALTNLLDAHQKAALYFETAYDALAQGKNHSLAEFNRTMQEAWSFPSLSLELIRLRDHHGAAARKADSHLKIYKEKQIEHENSARVLQDKLDPSRILNFIGMA